MVHEMKACLISFLVHSVYENKKDILYLSLVNKLLAF